MPQIKSRPGDPLTSRQRDILAFIRAYRAEHGYGCSMDDIRLAFGYVSRNAVLCHLKPMEKKGVITRGKNVSRSIVAVEDEPSAADRLRALAGIVDSFGLIRLTTDEAAALRRAAGMEVAP